VTVLLRNENQRGSTVYLADEVANADSIGISALATPAAPATPVVYPELTGDLPAGAITVSQDQGRKDGITSIVSAASAGLTLTANQAFIFQLAALATAAEFSRAYLASSAGAVKPQSPLLGNVNPDGTGPALPALIQKLSRANIGAGDETWTYPVPAPAQPVGTAAAGTTSLPAGTTNVVVTYVFAQVAPVGTVPQPDALSVPSGTGVEGASSPLSANVTVTATQKITVSAISGIPTGVKSVRYYLINSSTAGLNGLAVLSAAGPVGEQDVSSTGTVPAVDIIGIANKLIVPPDWVIVANQSQLNWNKKPEITSRGIGTYTKNPLNGTFGNRGIDGVFPNNAGTVNQPAPVQTAPVPSFTAGGFWKAGVSLQVLYTVVAANGTESENSFLSASVGPSTAANANLHLAALAGLGSNVAVKFYVVNCTDPTLNGLLGTVLVTAGATAAADFPNSPQSTSAALASSIASQSGSDNASGDPYSVPNADYGKVS
jgi:hypothetical protein